MWEMSVDTGLTTWDVSPVHRVGPSLAGSGSAELELNYCPAVYSPCVLEQVAQFSESPLLLTAPAGSQLSDT